VHHPVIDHHVRAEHVADALMAEAHANVGIVVLNVRMMSLERPDSLGEHGPGEISSRSGLSARTLSTLIWSLRLHLHLYAHLAQILDEVVGEYES